MTPPADRQTAVTAVVLARDEAQHILPCLRTLLWCEAQLVVLDSRATEEMSALASVLGARVMVQAWESWAAQRNAALEAVETAWVLFVDVDERVPLELANEIRTAVNAASVAGEPSGFWIPRQNLILGRWIRAAGWEPDYQLRLFRVDRGAYDATRAVHELVQLRGREARLNSRLVHHNYASWRQFWWKQMSYARAEAVQLHAAGVRARPHSPFLQALRELRRRYVKLGGYRSGLLGLQLSLVLAAADGVKYAALWRMGRAPASHG
jgi:hypothetical protein